MARRTEHITLAAIWGPELQRVIAALATVDAELPSKVKEKMKKALVPAVQDAKDTVSSLPIRGSSGKHTGLRKRVAAGVAITDTPKGMSVTTSMSEADETIIPLGMDRPEGWRHPVFGNRDVWVTQTPMRSGWFTNTMSDHADDIERSVDEALDWAADFVDKSA